MTQAGGHPTLEQLSAFIDGELSAAERARVEAHTAICDACRAEQDELRRTVSLIRGLPVPAPPRSFKVASQSQLVAPRPAPDLPWLRPLAAAAAALVVVSLAAVVLVGPRARHVLESANAGLGAPSAAQFSRAPTGPQEMARPDSAATADPRAALEAPRMRGPAAETAADPRAAPAPPATAVAPDALRAVEAGRPTPTLAEAALPLAPALGRRVVVAGGMVRIAEPTDTFTLSDAIYAVVYFDRDALVARGEAPRVTFRWQVAGREEMPVGETPDAISDSPLPPMPPVLRSVGVPPVFTTHACALARNLDPEGSNNPSSLRIEADGVEVAAFTIRIGPEAPGSSPASCDMFGRG